MRIIATSLLLLLGSLQAKDYYYFVPPPGWELADSSTNTSLTKASFISKAHPGCAISLSMEPADGSLKDYIAAVKALFAHDPNARWRDVGPYKTTTGEGKLVEIEMKSTGGEQRLLQLITLQNNVAYIVTTTAPKGNFALLAPTFKKVLQSFACTSDPLIALNDPQKKTLIENAIHAFQTNAKEVESPEIALQKVVVEQFSEMGALWQMAVLQMAQDTRGSCKTLVQGEKQ
ncbi:MAG: hypothetical protein JSR58_07360 [Verrucomicrobia bacterium]|nr:hypothetical protein [Verrucomicrobiota bacterium]